MREKLRWTLKNEDSGSIYVLARDPKGWDELQLTHNRSEEYHGIFFDFSLEVAFSCKGGGKEFIDAVYGTKGSEGNVSILVEYKCPSGWTRLFDGKLNYSTYKQEYRGRVLYTSMDIIKKGITQVVKSREDTDVDLLATESIGGTALVPYSYAPYDLNMHSRIVHIESEWELEEHSCCLRGMDTQLQQLYFIPNMNVINDDFEKTSESNVMCHHTTVFQGFLGGVRPILNTNENIWLTQENTVTVHYNISGTVTFTGRVATSPSSDPCDDTCGTLGLGILFADSVNMVFRIFWGLPDSQVLEEGCSGDTTVLSQNLFFKDVITIPTFAMTSNPMTRTFTASGSFNIQMTPGYALWAYWVMSMDLQLTEDWVVGFDYTNKEIRVQSDTISDSTEAKAVAIHEAWSRVCEGITDQTLAFKSEFFGRTNSQGLSYTSNGYASFTAILDGLRIRNFTQTSTPTGGKETKKGIVTNLKDIYNSCNAVWGIGLGIEELSGQEIIRAEELTYFYSDTSIIKLSNIPDLQMSFDSSMGYNEVEIGYSKWKLKEKGGLDEPNTIARWVFAKIKAAQQKLERVSKYVAGMYAIEVTRRKVFSATEDSEYDDDNFFIALKRNVNELNICEKDENFTSVTNLLSPSTAYNLRFNLFSNFDRLMNQFTGNLTKDQPHPINYSYLEGNGNMTFQINENHAGDLNNNVVQNVQDTAYQNSLHRRPDPILLPEIYTFSYPLKFSEYLLILANPYGYIEFSEDTTDYKKGYIKTFNFNLKRKMGEFTLIRKFE